MDDAGREEDNTVDQPHEYDDQAFDDVFSAFKNSWLSGNKYDPDEFCKTHSRFGTDLRNQIDEFIDKAGGLFELKGEGNQTLAHDVFDGQEINSLGDFRIIKEIGNGAMGVVYEAEQISLNRKVALKVLPAHLSFSDGAIRKFEREAEAAGRQSHPGIVSIYAVGEHKGVHYIAQELVGDGSTLNDYLHRFRHDEKQPPGYFRETAKIIFEVADALQHAHDAGVIHRDIKPSNILMMNNNRPKVTDFGLAKVEDALVLSRTGDFAGTPYYMSPEQAMARRMGIDNRTDIYSLGVTLYEMLTLKCPFEGDTSYEVFKKIVYIDPLDPYKENPKVPSDLSTICLKSMEKLPEKRYQSMRELSEDLKRFLLGDVILAKPAGWGTRLWKYVKRYPAASFAASVAFLAIAILIGYVIWSYPQLKAAKDKAEKLQRIAIEERDKALVAEDEADKQRDLSERRYEQLRQFSDRELVYRLNEDDLKIWPACPETSQGIENWIVRAEDVVNRLEIHERSLYSVRRDATKTKDGFVYYDNDTQAKHDMLSILVTDLTALSGTEKGLLQSMRNRFRTLKAIEHESIHGHRESWNNTIESIADIEKCPQYNGLIIKPQIGLIPIGQDDTSGLWEFSHLQTGEITERDLNGKLKPSEETGIVFVLIPGGSFEMGAFKPSSEHPKGSHGVDPLAYITEQPVHTVTVEPFFLSKYEMTQGQWLRITGKNPSEYKPGKDRGNKKSTLRNPVELVNWLDCAELMRRLCFRLPTESEWEYAARAGTTSFWWTGKDKKTLNKHVNLLDLYAIRNEDLDDWKGFEEDWLDDGYLVHAPVGSYLPNQFGLHDIGGNVWEWCQDGDARDYSNTPVDGSAYQAKGAKYRIYRGGGWRSSARWCRPSNRNRGHAGNCNERLGLRPARSLK